MLVFWVGGLTPVHVTVVPHCHLNGSDSWLLSVTLTFSVTVYWLTSILWSLVLIMKGKTVSELNMSLEITTRCAWKVIAVVCCLCSCIYITVKNHWSVPQPAPLPQERFLLTPAYVNRCQFFWIKITFGACLKYLL